MTQELIDLRTSILDGRYEDALAIIDELQGMSKQAILRNKERERPCYPSWAIAVK